MECDIRIIALGEYRGPHVRQIVEVARIGCLFLT